MNRIYIFIIFLFGATSTSFAQKIIRSSMSSFGNAVNENGTVYRQTIGQSSNTSVFSNDKTSLRQGFQQPVLSQNSNSSKEKECTLYLSPNPASAIVNIRFAEEIGENQISVFDMLGKLHFKINIISPTYEMDVSKLPRGVYMVNVVSKSGYHCNQKLIVI
jgi:hypothetical protein